MYDSKLLPQMNLEYTGFLRRQTRNLGMPQENGLAFIQQTPPHPAMQRSFV